MHQEIMSHQSLVESVCEKAQQLVNQTKDKSLNTYLQSIKTLFNNIVSKSQVGNHFHPHLSVSPKMFPVNVSSE